MKMDSVFVFDFNDILIGNSLFNFHTERYLPAGTGRDIAQECGQVFTDLDDFFRVFLFGKNADGGQCVV